MKKCISKGRMLTVSCLVMLFLSFQGVAYAIAGDGAAVGVAQESTNPLQTLHTRSSVMYEHLSKKKVDSKKSAENNGQLSGYLDISKFEDILKIDQLSEAKFYEEAFDAKFKSAIITSDDKLLILKTDKTYGEIAATKERLSVLELMGVVPNGTSAEFLATTEKQSAGNSHFGSILMLLLMSSPIIVWIIFMARGSLKRKKAYAIEQEAKRIAAATKEKITFDKVQGIDEMLPDLRRLVDALKHPAKYKKLGARPTKGVVLYGPPGTGKTLIAKAISGEAGVPFFSASGSDFVEKYVGVGASRVRDLFANARRQTPCIIFIDEIDAVGGGRGDTNNSERDQTVNALLTELDGFNGVEGVLTICATNRLDMLDSALTRPGRFDLKIAVNLPDKKARLAILKLHAENKKLDDDVDLDAIAKKTNGFSGAELENLLNEAALIAAMRNSKHITNVHVEDAFFKIIMDGHKKERIADNDYAKLVAYHEAGHTLATKLLTNDGVPTVTIVQSTSGAGGVTFRAPEDVPLKSKKYLRNLIKVMYAGRAAEELLLGNDDDITTGASQDIKQATNIIKQYIGIYGMGNKGMIDVTQLASNIDIVDEASALATDLYYDTVAVLQEHRGKLDGIAQALIDKETLDEHEIDAIINGVKAKDQPSAKPRYVKSIDFETQPQTINKNSRNKVFESAAGLIIKLTGITKKKKKLKTSK